MQCEIRLKGTSQGIVIPDAVNAYEKGSFYCVYLPTKLVRKFPIQDIFEVQESYS